MLKTALGGALIGMILLIVVDCLENWAYLELKGQSFTAYAPWQRREEVVKLWLLYTVAPGIPLGAFTGIALHLGHQGKRAAALALCRRIGFLATVLIGITIASDLYQAYGNFIAAGNTVGNAIPNALAWAYWADMLVYNFVTYGALQWSVLLWMAGYTLKRLDKKPDTIL